jgi:hypothetical protein
MSNALLPNIPGFPPNVNVTVVPMAICSSVVTGTPARSLSQDGSNTSNGVPGDSSENEELTPAELPESTPYQLFGQSLAPFKVEYKNYWPNDGDEWCLTYDALSATCTSATTMGLTWSDWGGVGAACPERWYGSWFIIEGLEGREFWCIDTGVSSFCENDTCYVLIISDEPMTGSSVAHVGLIR